MPSGAKKRKAAKRKKEQETHDGKSSSNNNGPKGNNDVSFDGGEAGSTAYQEHHNHQDQFNKRNEELEERGAPSVRPNASEDKSTKGVPSDVEAVQKVGVENAGVVRIERELKEDSAIKNLNTKEAKSAKGSYNGNDRSSSSSSSSSSSDDESRVVERRRKEDAYASVSEGKPHSDSVRPVDSSPPEVIQTTEYAPAGKTTSSVREKVPSVDPGKHEVSAHLTESTPLESPVISNDVVKTGLENGGEKLLPTGAPVTLTGPVSNKIDERASLLQDETAKASSSVVESVSKRNESEVLPSLDTSLPQVSNDAESIKDPEIPEYSEKQPLVDPAQPVVQKTSWFSCCGILDAITGSSR